MRIEKGELVKTLGVLNFTLILSRPTDFQAKELNSGDFVKKREGGGGGGGRCEEDKRKEEEEEEEEGEEERLLALGHLRADLFQICSFDRNY